MQIIKLVKPAEIQRGGQNFELKMDYPSRHFLLAGIYLLLKKRWIYDTINYKFAVAGCGCCLKCIVKRATQGKRIVFGFFSGSATTAHAVMQLNVEDGEHRKFIMVQLPEKYDEQSEA